MNSNSIVALGLGYVSSQVVYQVTDSIVLCAVTSFCVAFTVVKLLRK